MAGYWVRSGLDKSMHANGGLAAVTGCLLQFVYIQYSLMCRQPVYVPVSWQKGYQRAPMSEGCVRHGHRVSLLKAQ